MSSIIESPKGCFKHELQTALNNYSYSDFTSITYRVIMEERKVDLAEAKRIKKLWRKEVISILQEFGELELIPAQHHIQR